MHNQTRNKILALVSLAFLTIFSLKVNACENQERIYLIQILNQINSIKPLILSAAKTQSTSNRIQFHYTKYHDLNGIERNGLLDDVNEIENGIKEKLNKIPVEPRVFQSLNGDYIDHSKNGNKP